MSETQTERPETGLAAMNDLPHSALYVLAAVNQARPTRSRAECPSGQDVADALTAVGYNINHGVLYPRLDDLADAGYVERLDGPDRRSNAYRVTERGEKLLASATVFFSPEQPR